MASEQLGRRGRTIDPAWAYRRLLLRAGDQMSAAGLRAGRSQCWSAMTPPTKVGAAWGCKELLRALLAAPATTQPTGSRFYDACLAANMTETTRLAERIAT